MASPDFTVIEPAGGAVQLILGRTPFTVGVMAVTAARTKGILKLPSAPGT